MHTRIGIRGGRPAGIGRTLSVAAALAVSIIAAPGGQANTEVARAPQRRVSTPGLAGDWPLHNKDLYNSRYSELAEINGANIDTLVPKWTFQAARADGIAQSTPIVIDEVMYFASGSKLVALDASTGKERWTFQADPAFPGGGRGPAYGDGRIYAYGRSTMYAVEAETGKLAQSFGDKGLLPIVKRALDFKYPGKYPADLDPTTLGYSMTNPPTYFRGTLYVGLPFSDSLIPGGLLVAADGKTGAIKWVFNTVPQGPQDEGWEIVKDTWSGATRYGGGIWTQPAIDPDLGLLFFNAGNPTPNYDGSSRKGMNLFTNSVIALHLATGKLAWHYQVIHHDIWDWDLVNGPVLFDVARRGQTVKGLAVFAKNCLAYMFRRDTGQPINPIPEMVVPTTSDVPGEQVWPTQPMPYTADGQPQPPFCATFPIIENPELAKRARPFYHPNQVKEFVITSPGTAGGANYGSPSFSSRTGLVYVTGKNDAWSIKVRPIGDSLKPEDGFKGHYSLIAETGEKGVTTNATLTAYEPGTGRRAWQTQISGLTNGGNLVTAGDLVFQGIGTGDFYAFDARSGKQLLQRKAPGGIIASPLTYSAAGRQLVAIVAGNAVVAYGLP